MKEPKIQNYLKTLNLKDSKGKPYKHVIFDYDKIYEDDAPVWLVISERGAKGKSTQAKRLARKIWETKKLRSMWIMNTEKLLEKEYTSHLTKPKQYLTDIFTGKERVAGGRVFADDNANSWYTRFASLSGAENEKGSRDDYGVLFYDEFNVGTRNIQNAQTDLISSLIATLHDPVNKSKNQLTKFIIHGNFKSLNNDFLMSMGVFKIEGEVTTLYMPNGKPLMRILAPEFTEQQKQEFEKNNENDWVFQFQKKLGKANHVYFNENLHDEIMSVSRHKADGLESKSTYYIYSNTKYYRLRNYGSFFYVDLIEKDDIHPKAQLFSISSQEFREGTVYNLNLKRNMKKVLGKTNLWFDSSYTRENILRSLRRN